ncbi:MAG: hypothetical protein NT169_16595 [Chloroflexi bacterium]|nr:hypothetical protein [Chloroflexota bacterium]
MLDWRRLTVRYSRLTWQQRLGNLASTLARSATVSNSSRAATSVADLLREGMWIIEWSAPDAPLDILTELAPMQRELGLLRQAWERDAPAIQPMLAFRARALSDRVLELSGLSSS